MVGNGDRDPVRLLFDHLLEHQFMGRVLKGIEEADRNGLNPLFQQAKDRCSCVLGIELFEHCPVASDPLVHLHPENSWDKRLRELRKDVIRGITDLPAELQHIPETSGGDQPCFCTLSLDDGIDHQGSAMDHLVQLPNKTGDLFLQLPDPLLHRIRGVPGGGQTFVDADFTGTVIQQHEIREGSPDIASQPVELLRHV